MAKSISSKLIPALAAIALCLGLSPAANAAIVLWDYGFNVDGTISYPLYGDPVPAAVDLSAFDDLSGLGTIGVTITGTGSHNFGALFDHEIDEPINTFFNEIGSASGTAAAGQGWEIDDPGLGFIYGDFESNLLLTNGGNYLGGPNDVAMAMSWDFMLAQGETALITLALTETAPSGFFLQHFDPNSDISIFLSSSLDISISPIPVPAAAWLFASGLLGLIGFGRRRAAA